MDYLKKGRNMKQPIKEMGRLLFFFLLFGGLLIGQVRTADVPGIVTQFTGKDYPSDEGNKVILQWKYPAELAGRISFELYQRPLGSSEWVLISKLSPDLKKPGVMEQHVNQLEPGKKYQFKVVVRLPEGALSTSEVITVAPIPQWFNRFRLPMLLCVLFLSGAILYYISLAKKGVDIYLRPIPGLKAFEEAVGRATEMGKPVLFVPGIMDLDQVETVSGVIILGHVARMTARFETGLEVPVSRSLVMEAGREIVKESYLAEGRPDLYKDDMVHYLTDDQFAYAAGVDGIMLREKPAACFYQGKFYAESLILAETGNSIGAIQIAGTGSPAQLPFFITACDYTLIGEEFFAASAYLSKEPKLVGSLKGQDLGKLIVMIAIILGSLLELLRVIGVISYDITELFKVV